MKPSSSPSLTYAPAYIGLFASLVLAVTCNCFLDAHYGIFGLEVFLWSVGFALSLFLGWHQRGEVSSGGRAGQKLAVVLGFILTFLVFLPMLTIPRAGLWMLSTLQIAQNCVTVSRRQLHMGILVSLIMVLFATSHFRADWTMLFYLVPYVATVVFTLVAEQISRRARDIRRESLGAGSAGGQWAAILTATATILIGGALLYAITPQVSSPKLFWKFGQPGVIGYLGNEASAGQKPGGQEDGRERRPHLAELTLNDMLKAASSLGMPKWQSFAIVRLADLAESIDMTLSPIRLGIDEFWENLKKWVKEHRREMGQSLIVLIVLALLVATWRLLKESRPGIWLFAYLDYLRLGILRWHLPGNPGAVQYYKAFLRLLDLYGLARPATANAREYLADVCHEYRHLRREAVELTLCFEQARYGKRIVAPVQLARMREIYRRVFRRLHSPDSGGS